MTWGIKPSEQAVTWWGARAIYKPDTQYPVDLLPDRQQITGEDGRGDLIGWLNSVGLEYARTYVKHHYLGNDEDTVVCLVDEDEGYCIKFSPRSSSGYLYMGACALTDEIISAAHVSVKHIVNEA